MPTLLDLERLGGEPHEIFESPFEKILRRKAEELGFSDNEIYAIIEFHLYASGNRVKKGLIEDAAIEIAAKHNVPIERFTEMRRLFQD